MGVVDVVAVHQADSGHCSLQSLPCPSACFLGSPPAAAAAAVEELLASVVAKEVVGYLAADCFEIVWCCC